MIVTRKLIQELIYEELQNRLCVGDTIYYNHPIEKEFIGKFIVRHNLDGLLYIQKYVPRKTGDSEHSEYDKMLGWKLHEWLCEGINIIDPNASVSRMVLTEKTIK